MHTQHVRLELMKQRTIDSVNENELEQSRAE